MSLKISFDESLLPCSTTEGRSLPKIHFNGRIKQNLLLLGLILLTGSLFIYTFWAGIGISVSFAGMMIYKAYQIVKDVMKFDFDVNSQANKEFYKELF